MKKIGTGVFLAIIIPCSSWAFECKVCHSKNPAMVRMHKAVQGRGCFDCHKMGEKLMGKGRPKDFESLVKRRNSEAPCMECHKHPAEAATPG